MHLSKRIKNAFEANPLLDLARELLKEGMDEVSFMEAVKEARKNGKIVDDVAVLTIRNYLRDLKLGIKK